MAELFYDSSQVTGQVTVHSHNGTRRVPLDRQTGLETNGTDSAWVPR
jgi:hypothetical protein